MSYLVPASCLSPGGGGVCSVEQAGPARRLDNSEPQKAFLLHCCCNYSEQSADICLNKSTLWPIIKITPLKTPAPLQVPLPWVIPLSVYPTPGPLQQKGQSKHHAHCCHFKPRCISIMPGPLFILNFPGHSFSLPLLNNLFTCLAHSEELQPLTVLMGLHPTLLRK